MFFGGLLEPGQGIVEVLLYAFLVFQEVDGLQLIGIAAVQKAAGKVNVRDVDRIGLSARALAKNVSGDLCSRR
jgi:hypothetical protein